jgi:hypothetical protein
MMPNITISSKKSDAPPAALHRPSKLSIPPIDTRPCYKPWKVTVKIIKGTNLPAADSVLASVAKGVSMFAVSDPMVFMEVDGCVGRSSVVMETLNPKWADEPFVFNLLLLEV